MTQLFPFKTDYNLSKILGSGTYGIVYLTTKNPPTALKKMIIDATEDQDDREMRLLNLVELNVSLKHPNIAQVLTYGFTRNRLAFYIEMQFGGQNLLTYVENNDMSSKVFNIIITQFLEGISYMHSKGIVHGDLKSENVTYNPDTGKVLIIDFDLALPEKNRMKKIMVDLSEQYVTRWYRAPEILLGCRQENLISYGIDVWSIGCIWYELLNEGKALFQGDSAFGQIVKIFEIVGTPSVTSFPGLKACVNYQKTFPQFPRLANEINTSPIYSRIFVVDPLKRISCSDLLTLYLKSDF